MCRSVVVVILAFASACASTTFIERTHVAPERDEAALMQDAKDGLLDDTGFDRAAMIVGGPSDPKAIDRALGLLRTKLAPVLAMVRGVDSSRRAAELHRLLRSDLGEGAVLRREVSAATPLFDTVATGAYDAISATMVYAIAAGQLGIAAPLIVDGTEVDAISLLAAAYSKMAVAAAEKHAHALAHAMADRSDALADERTKEALRERRALQLTDLASTAIDRGELAHAEAMIASGGEAAQRESTRASLASLEHYRLAQLSLKDPSGAALAFLRLAIDRHSKSYIENAKAVAFNHLNTFAQAGECDALQTAEIEWEKRVFDPEHTELLASCYSVRARKLFDSKDFGKMIKEMRTATRSVPKDRFAKQNLLVALSSQVDVLLKENRCDAARPLLEEGKRLDPKDAFISDALQYCTER